MKAAGHFPGRCALNSVERTWRNASTDVAVVKTNRTRAHVAFTPWAESNQTEVVGNWRKTTLFHNNLPSIGCTRATRGAAPGAFKAAENPMAAGTGASRRFSHDHTHHATQRLTFYAH
jgi:hypothetical protein